MHRNAPVTHLNFKQILVSHGDYIDHDLLKEMLETLALDSLFQFPLRPSFVFTAMIWPSLLALSSLSLIHAAERDVDCEDKVATTWFTGWHANEGFNVSDVPWSKYTEVTFAFA